MDSVQEKYTSLHLHYSDTVVHSSLQRRMVEYLISIVRIRLDKLRPWLVEWFRRAFRLILAITLSLPLRFPNIYVRVTLPQDISKGL